MFVSLGVNRADDSLFSILNKVTRQMPDSAINAALTKYGILEEKVGLAEFLRKNWLYFVAAAAIVAVVILLLVLRNVKTSQRAEEGRRIISETERDPLTDLYNWNYFLVYANRGFGASL